MARLDAGGAQLTEATYRYSALGEYIPQAPTDEEAKRHNQNLPGMGGVFNTVNASLYHYAGNNPVKYTDPTGKWTDNEDGTFTAEAGDTLWRLYGSGWQERSDYTGDPTKLQVGDIVGKKRENHDVWNSVRTTNNDVINEEPNSKAYYQSMFGAGITLVGGGNFEVGFVWDTLGNKGIAISGDLGCGVSADIELLTNKDNEHREVQKYLFASYMNKNFLRHI